MLKELINKTYKYMSPTTALPTAMTALHPILSLDAPSILQRATTSARTTGSARVRVHSTLSVQLLYLPVSLLTQVVTAVSTTLRQYLPEVSPSTVVTV